jgi:hypothetical protein
MWCSRGLGWNWALQAANGALVTEVQQLEANLPALKERLAHVARESAAAREAAADKEKRLGSGLRELQREVRECEYTTWVKKSHSTPCCPHQSLRPQNSKDAKFGIFTTNFFCTPKSKFTQVDKLEEQTTALRQYEASNSSDQLNGLRQRTGELEAKLAAELEALDLLQTELKDKEAAVTSRESYKVRVGYPFPVSKGCGCCCSCATSVCALNATQTFGQRRCCSSPICHGYAPRRTWRSWRVRWSRRSSSWPGWARRVRWRRSLPSCAGSRSG